MKIGVTFACFHLLGHTPLDNDNSNMIFNGLDKVRAQFTKICGLTSSTPALFTFNSASFLKTISSEIIGIGHFSCVLSSNGGITSSSLTPKTLLK